MHVIFLSKPIENGRAVLMDKSEWLKLRIRLSESSFRSRFKFNRSIKEYALRTGRRELRHQAEVIIRTRLASANPENDGKQTPMRGHPVFIAQHATACCCRSCLEKWHHIPKGRALTDEEISNIADMLIFYIDDQMADTSFSDDGEQLTLF